MKKLINKIKHNRTLYGFFDAIEISENSISDDIDYLYDGQIVFYYEFYQRRFIIYKYAITALWSIEYNRKVHDLIVNFVGMDYKYYVLVDTKLYTIDDFDKL